MATKQSKEYREGVAAFGQGWPSNANPHVRNKHTSYSIQRQQWYDGWYDSRIGKRLGPIFEKYDISWP